ncbi:MAG TPA: TetR family transcriptional regulator [Caulobacteraceae bacterium]
MIRLSTLDGGAPPAKFEARREEIIGVATGILNRRGVRSMTLAEVAAACGMATTGIAYYFGRKEDLAAACFVAGLDRLEAMVQTAADVPTAGERVRRFLVGYFEHKARVVRGREREIPILSDIRTLSEPIHTEVSDRYAAFFQSFRELLRAPDLRWLRGDAAWARTHLILEHIYWLNVWLPWFEVEDYPRLCERVLDLLFNGLAAEFRPDPTPLEIGTRRARGGAPPDAFLIAATREVNIHGFKGASVDRISASLKRTKGAFYHHNSSKDELLVAGFERTFDILREGQSAAMRAGGDALEQLRLAVVTLLAFQLSPRGPLMRTSALQSLPTVTRHAMIERSNRVTARFAGMIADGVAQGVMRRIDPLIAAQMITASINAIADLRLGPERGHAREHIGRYMTPILYGLFAPVSAPAR